MLAFLVDASACGTSITYPERRTKLTASLEPTLPVYLRTKPRLYYEASDEEFFTLIGLIPQLFADPNVFYFAINIIGNDVETGEVRAWSSLFKTIYPRVILFFANAVA